MNNFKDSDANYRKRLKALPGQVIEALDMLPGEGPYSAVEIERIRFLAAELNELLHWQVYQDSYSRNSSWLFRNHLCLSLQQARFLLLAFDADPSLRKDALAEAFEAYTSNLKKGRISDPFVAAWLEEHEGE